MTKTKKQKQNLQHEWEVVVVVLDVVVDCRLTANATRSHRSAGFVRVVCCLSCVSLSVFLCFYFSFLSTPTTQVRFAVCIELNVFKWLNILRINASVARLSYHKPRVPVTQFRSKIFNYWSFAVKFNVELF